MALTYEYDDTFITNSVALDDQEKAEVNAMIEAEMLGVTSVYLLEKIIISLVYQALCGLQLESDGMKEKKSFYSKEYDRYLSMSRHGNTVDKGLYSIPIGRA